MSAPTVEPPTRGSSRSGLLLAFALALPIFLVDITQRGDVALAVLYGIAVLQALRTPGRRPVLAFAALCSVLSVLGAITPWPAGAEWPLILKNRVVGMLAIWGTALAGLHLRDLAQVVDLGQARLRESEARFRSVLDTVREPIFVYGITADGRPQELLEANEAATRMYGYARDELRGLELARLVSSTDNLERLPALVRCMRREGSVLVESEHRTNDGRPISVEVRAQLIELGGRAAVLAVARDISERKRAEETIRDSERRERARADELEALMEAVPALVFVAHDPQGRRITGNRAACEMLRMPRGANLSQGAPPQEEPRHYRSYQGDQHCDPGDLPVQRAARGEPLWGYEEVVRFDDGSARHLFGNAVPLRDRHGEVRGALAAAVDVTERKRAEERLQRLTEELERRVEARTADLVASDRALAKRTRQLQQLTSELTQAEQRERRKLSRILHDDIQQLLTAVKLQMELIRRAEPEALPAAVARATDHLDQAIHSARVLSHELSPRILYDSGLADALRWLAGRKKREYDLDLRVEADTAAEPASEDVKVLLFQGVRELLLNVIKHAKVSEARVALRRSGADRVCLSVADGGVGFDAGAARARSHGSDQLGLFGIRERLEVLGGHMEIDSTPGQGTTVRLYAPAGEPSPYEDDP